LLLDKYHTEQTVWHVSAEGGNTDILQKMWEWAEEILTVEELRKFDVSSRRIGTNNLHRSVMWGDIDVLGKVWEWGKENLTA